MKKVLFTFVLAVFSVLTLLSQAPPSFKYQAVVRDKAGQVLPNQSISLHISILQSASDGPEVYREHHSVTTSELGLVTIEVGRGKSLIGSMAAIDWGGGSHFLRVEMDPSGGTNYELMGVSELLSVPYALYAAEAGSGQREADLDWEITGGHVVTGHGGSYPAGNVGIGNNAPGTLLYVAKNMGEPTITIRNLGGGGGATYSMVDDLSGADWKFKATTYGGFKIRDHANLMDVLVIEPNSAANAIYIKGGGNVGIGTGTPQFKLDVIADAQVNGVRVGRGSGNTSNNTVLGTWAMSVNVSGNKNTAIGSLALQSNIDGYSNTATGAYALNFNTCGYYNTAIGYVALRYNTEGNFNTASGTEALNMNTSGSCNTANGAYALKSNTTGDNNTAYGYEALSSNTYPGNNTAIGSGALHSNTSGFSNTATGSGALHSNTTGHSNAASGNFALYHNITGQGNTANGHMSLYHNATGGLNTATGEQSLFCNTTGDHNTANGYQSLYNNTSGHRNTAIGKWAGNWNQSGNGNTCLGYDADVSSGALTNATALGNGTTVNTSNKIRIGNASVTVIEGQVDWSYPSDGRFKQNVTEDVQGLAFIRLLRPVIYNFNTRKYTEFLMKNMPDSLRNERMDAQDFTTSTAIRHSGFVAQEVVKAAADCGYDFNGVHVPVDDNDNYSIAYGQFVVPLVKGMQEQQEMIEKQQAMIEEQRAMIQALHQRVASLEAERGE